VVQAVLDKLPDAVLVAETGAINFANELAHRLLGASPGTLVGTRLERWLAAGELSRLETIVGQRSDRFPDLPETFRLRLVRADGQFVLADARFATDGASRILLLRDATRLARTEQLMSRLASVSRSGKGLQGADALLDEATPVFLELGWRAAYTQIVPQGSVTLRSVATLPGDPVGEYAASLIGRTIPRDKTPVLNQVVTERRAIFLDNLPTYLVGPPRQAERLAQSLAESHAYRTAWCPVRNPAGDITHLLTVAGRDMSEGDFVALQLFAAQLGEANELARLRAELVQHERLAAVGEMSAVLAHEIRNPLGVVFNVANALKRTVSGDVNASMLESLLEEADRLRRLTTDLLDFASSKTSSLAPVAVEPLVAEVVAAAALENARHARVEVSVPADVPRVLADEPHLRRVLLNLCVNAQQHVARGGRVLLAAEAREGHVRLRVENDGEPVPPGLEQRIFEPFFTTRAAGAGLGLAVVKKLVDDLGGRVEVERRTAGACFVVTLRAATPGHDA
jgi:signal transduction histidine kinase